MKSHCVCLLFSFLLFSYSFPSFGQNKKFAGLPSSISKVFKGYKILDYAKGDLNLNGKDDFIVAMAEQGCGDNRSLYIFFDNGEDYKLFAYNCNAILDRFCGGMYGDCFQGMVIKNGYFSIEYYGGSGNNKWSYNFTFKYDRTKNEIFLYRIGGAGSETYGLEPDDKHADFVFKAVHFGMVNFRDYSVDVDYTDN